MLSNTKRDYPMVQKRRGLCIVYIIFSSFHLHQFSPDSMSSKLDLASGWRNSDLGVNTISWSSRDKERDRTCSVTWTTLSCMLSHILCPSSCYGTYRLPEGLQDLSAENVEIVCRSRAVDNDPVTVVQLTHCKVLWQFLTREVGEMVSLPRFLYPLQNLPI